MRSLLIAFTFLGGISLCTPVQAGVFSPNPTPSFPTLSFDDSQTKALRPDPFPWPLMVEFTAFRISTVQPVGYWVPGGPFVIFGHLRRH